MSNFSLNNVQIPEPGSLMPRFQGPMAWKAEENYANGVQCSTESPYCRGQPGGMVRFHMYITHLGEQVCLYCGCRRPVAGGRRRRRRTHRKRTHKRRASRRNRRTARR